VKAGVAVLLPLVAAVALGTMPTSTVPRRADVVAATVPVASTVVACPPGRLGASTDATTGYGAAPGSGDGSDDAAPVSLSLTGDAAGTTRAVRLDRGVLGRLGDAVVEGPGATVSGEDRSAPGVFAFRWDQDERQHSAAAAGCGAPSGDWWFAGAGAGVRHSSVLLLRNVDEGPAVVDVRVHGATGNVDQAGSRGIVVAPATSLRVPLVDLAPGSEEITVEVVAARGRVVASVADTLRGGPTPGVEWLQPGTSPAPDVDLVGIPAGGDRKLLLVTNPGESQAVVGVQVLNTHGAFVPLGAEELSVPPDGVTRVDLTHALRDGASTVRLHADVPVTGVVRTTRGADQSDSVVAAALQGPAILPVNGAGTVVQLSSGEDAAEAVLGAWSADGRRLGRRRILVPSSRLATWAVPAGAAYVVVEPTSGDLRVAGSHSGPGIATSAATPLLLTVTRPVVGPYRGDQSPS
jgi:hypothetical protein